MSAAHEPPKPSGRWIGYFEAIAAASLWGSSGIFAVHLFRLGVPPESVALLRPVVGVVFVALLLALRAPGALRTDRRGLLVLGVGGGLAIGVFQLAYQLSTDAVGVPSTVALLYLAPALVTAAAGPLLGEWPSVARIALVVLTLLGVWLSVLGAHDVVPTFGTTGVAWGVLAGASYGAYTLFGRFASPRYGAARTVFYSTLGSCVFLAITVPSISGPIVLPEGPRAWGLLLAFGLLTIAVAHFLFFDALARIEASRVSVAAAIEPVVAGVLATALLGQGLSPLGWGGIGLVVIGVAGAGVRRDRARTPSSVG
jgi:DME family drug/metabolite transporter